MVFLRIIFILFATIHGFAPAKAKDTDLLVFAASSLRDVMLDIRKPFELQCGCRVTISFAASSILARQIEAGAPANVFVSANKDWVEWLGARKRTLGEPQTIAKNRLVIASTARTRDSFNILMRDRFSMGDPSGVPAGVYAKEALEKMGLWANVQKNAVFTENVRVALSMIARGDLQSGIVYESDLIVEPALHVHYRFPEDTHSPILYQAVALSDATVAGQFMQFLNGPDAQMAFRKAGFLEVVND